MMYKEIASGWISDKTCERYKAKIDGKEIKFEYYDKQNVNAFDVILSGDGKRKTDGDATGILMYGQNVATYGNQKIFITVGELNVLAIAQAIGHKYQVVCPAENLGVLEHIRENLEYVLKFDEIVMAMPKQYGELQTKISDMFEFDKVRIVSYGDFEDAYSTIKTGKTNELKDVLFNPISKKPNDLIFCNELDREEFKTKEPFGIAYPYPKLNEMTRGIKAGQVILFTAGTGIGKSTIARQIAYHLLKQTDKKMAMIFLEEGKRETVDGFLGMELKVPSHLLDEDPMSFTTEEEYNIAWDSLFTSGRILFVDRFGAIPIDELISKIRYMKEALGIDIIFLDHISILVSGMSNGGGNEASAIEKLMHKLKATVKELGVTLITISHVNRNTSNKTSAQEGGQIGIDSLKGSSGLGQLSDIIIALERNQQDPDNSNSTQIRVLKVRTGGKTGLADSMLYNQITGVMYAVDNWYVEDYENMQKENEAIMAKRLFNAKNK